MEAIREKKKFSCFFDTGLSFPLGSISGVQLPYSLSYRNIFYAAPHLPVRRTRTPRQRHRA